jgi:hypothetical protein
MYYNGYYHSNLGDVDISAITFHAKTRKSVCRLGKHAKTYTSQAKSMEDDNTNTMRKSAVD